MHNRLLDILYNRDVPIDKEELARYIKGELDDASQHEVERKLQAGNDMESDAWEGWELSGNPKKLIRQSEAINQSINNQLQSRFKRERKRPITQLPVIWWVFGLLLVIIVLAWVIIRFY